MLYYPNFIKKLEEKYHFKKEYNYKTGKNDGLLYCDDFKITKKGFIRPYNGSNYKRYDLIYDLIKANLVEKEGIENE